MKYYLILLFTLTNNKGPQTLVSLPYHFVRKMSTFLIKEGMRGVGGDPWADQYFQDVSLPGLCKDMALKNFKNKFQMFQDQLCMYLF